MSEKYNTKILPVYETDLKETDPEFIEFFYNFAFDEVVNEEGRTLDDRTRMLAILYALLG